MSSISNGGISNASRTGQYQNGNPVTSTFSTTQNAAQFNQAMSPTATSAASSQRAPNFRPTFQLEPSSPTYQPASAEAEARTRASISPPIRSLPASQANDTPTSILGGRLDSIVTPNDTTLTGIPRLIEQIIAPIGAISNVAGKALDILGLQKTLASATVALIDNPITDTVLKTGARLGGMAFGLANQFLGDKTVSDMTSNTLNFISSELGGASLANPAVKSMGVNEGWKGALDAIVHENAGLNWYSTFFLGNLKNRTGGGEGPEFYKQLVVDTWDQDPAGREFLASVGSSALSRDQAAKWYSEYYYDVLDEESGNGIATKVADTLDYRFGLDANNINQVYKDGVKRSAAFALAHPDIAEDLHPSNLSVPFSSGLGSVGGGYAGADTSIVSHGGLSTSNSALPTGPELSTSTSHTRAYRNNDAAQSPLKALTDTVVGTGMAAIFGPATSILGGLLGKEGTGQVVAKTLDKLFSSDGGSMGRAFLEGASFMPDGGRAVSNLINGTLSSSAGTAWTITSMQQFSKDQDGIDMFQELIQPLMVKRADGTTALDKMLLDAQNNPVLANNLRAVADELSESLSAQNLLKSLGLSSFLTQVKHALPVASRYAYLETQSHADLPLSDPTRLKQLFANNVADQKPVDDRGNLTDFGKIGLRMFGHDLLDGRIDGDVALRTLLNPEGTDNSDLRRNVEFIKRWGEMDLADDNAINGSVYRKLVEDCWSILGGQGTPVTQNLALTLASNDDNIWRTDTAPMFDFKNFKVNLESYQQLAKNYNLTTNELTDLVLWGHILATLPADPNQRSVAFDKIIQNALQGTSIPTFENIFVRDVPGIREHFTQLIGHFDDFNQSIMSSLNKLFAAQATRAA